jgi:hypothetical protein
MNQFLEVGHALRNGDMVEIHIGPAAYDLTADAARQVLVYGSFQEIYKQVPQVTLDGSGREVGGFITLSRTRRSVTVKLKTGRPGRLCLINAEALRDVMRGKLPRAAVSEVIFAGSKPNTAAA